MAPSSPVYRGRLAPSPTGWLHLGHAATFFTAWTRAKEHGGALVLRNEDLDTERVRPSFVSSMMEDLRWLGLDWQEGPDHGGPHAPYEQSARHGIHAKGFEALRRTGFIYPCLCSRRDIRRALGAPQAEEDGWFYPGTCRHQTDRNDLPREGVNWRFRVPEGRAVSFIDGRAGLREYVAGRDFGDFIVWRKDDIPAYQLAVVLDDAAMGITEVVRGEDLLLSTARQLLIYRALSLPEPSFYHCPLLLDRHGQRLAKRHDSLSLRSMRQAGHPPGDILAQLKAYTGEKTGNQTVSLPY